MVKALAFTFKSYEDVLIEGAQPLSLSLKNTSKRDVTKKQTFLLVTMAADKSQLDNVYYCVVEHQRPVCFLLKCILKTLSSFTLRGSFLNTATNKNVSKEAEDPY